uniref:Argonaute 2a n=1 Tax=Mayetiola destructor TaxID=39758 RepID=K7Y7M8_MAYDE|nr:argonaute 2a [Mayetiola destructor]
MGGKNYPKGGGKKIPKKESIDGNKSKQVPDDKHGQPSKVESKLPKEQEPLPKPIDPNVPKEHSGQQIRSGGPKGQYQQQTRAIYSGQESSWSMPGPSSGLRPDATSEMVHRFSQQSLEPAKVKSDTKQLESEKSIKPNVVTTLKGSSKLSGTKGKPLGQIETNYVEIFTEKMVDFVYQYDVKITTVEAPSKPKKGKKHPKSIAEKKNNEAPKKYRQQIFEQFKKKHFRNIHMAYDGSNIAYSSKKLPLSLAIDKNVFFMDPITENIREYLVDISETDGSDIPLDALKKYAEKKEDIPPRALQALNTILKSAFQRVPNGILSGRSFYIPTGRMDLGDHFDLWFGRFQSVVVGDRVLLNVDIAHKGFPKPFGSLVKLWQAIEDGEKEINRRSPRYRQKNPADIMAQHLIGLNIIYNQPGDQSTKRMYKFSGIAKKPSEQRFRDEYDNEKTIEAYYGQRYPNFPIKNPDLPCIQLGATGMVIVPMEFCGISECQVTNKKYTELQMRNMIEITATSTMERKQRILEKMKQIKHNDSNILKDVHLKIDHENFIKVNARCLIAPTIEYGQSQTANVFKGSWKQDKKPFLTPGTATKWAILVLDRRVGRNFLEDLARKIVSVSKSNKLNMAAVPDYEFVSDQFLENMRKMQRFYVEQNEKDMLRKNIKAELKQQMTELRDKNVCILFCVGPDTGPDYGIVKQVAEIDVGILTQYLKGLTVLRKLNDSTISNILLKVNAKLNGVNHCLVGSPFLNDNIHKCMFIGADVTHPSPDQQTIPSIVGVVASHISNGFCYNPTWRLQETKDGNSRVAEIIQDFKNITTEHLQFYRKRNNNKLPDKIFYYRDGVSESQYQQVINTERMAMSQACAEIKPGYEKHVQITIIIVQKRHHTRFFPNKTIGIDANNNVPPGTIVDTEIVRSNPNEKHFFLVSHQALKGVARPTKYSVIYDNGQHDIDDIQQLTYNLCHLFSRCTRAVSYPAPTYYAHLMAYRGRNLIE